ncbi:helix-turn-helix domain-containing protein [Actinomadura terrae]|uniref:helix-turn-helix domain-containing protein n=1 Tax=Actinomadura terrae TaxID=604353 RepID=UPI002342F3DF|nr:helix-turn-helix domain-containing protein [Actinomadura terrae]
MPESSDAAAPGDAARHGGAARRRVRVNTLRYRIRRIADLTGRDLGTLEDRVDFFLAPRAPRSASTL